MNGEFNAVIKTVFDFVDQISENISDLRDRQEKIKIMLLSMLGTIIGLCVYNNYMTTSQEFHENKILQKKDHEEDKEGEHHSVKLSTKPPVKHSKIVGKK